MSNKEIEFVKLDGYYPQDDLKLAKELINRNLFKYDQHQFVQVVSLGEALAMREKNKLFTRIEVNKSRFLTHNDNIPDGGVLCWVSQRGGNDVLRKRNIDVIHEVRPSGISVGRGNSLQALLLTEEEIAELSRNTAILRKEKCLEGQE